MELCPHQFFWYIIFYISASNLSSHLKAYFTNVSCCRGLVDMLRLSQLEALLVDQMTLSLVDFLQEVPYCRDVANVT